MVIDAPKVLKVGRSDILQPMCQAKIIGSQVRIQYKVSFSALCPLINRIFAAAIPRTHIASHRNF